MKHTDTRSLLGTLIFAPYKIVDVSKAVRFGLFNDDDVDPCYGTHAATTSLSHPSHTSTNETLRPYAYAAFLAIYFLTLGILQLH